MKYIAIPMCLSGLIYSVAVAETLYYEQNNNPNCVGYYKNYYAGNVTSCPIADRVFTIPYYEAINYFLPGDTEPAGYWPTELPAFKNSSTDTLSDSCKTQSNIINNTSCQDYFNTARLCYPGYGYKKETATVQDNTGHDVSRTMGFHCEQGQPQAAGTYKTITLASSNGSQTYAILDYADIVGEYPSRVIWDDDTNVILSSEFLPDSIVNSITAAAPAGLTLRGFTTESNVASIGETVSDDCSNNKVWVGTRLYNSSGSSETQRRLFANGSNILSTNAGSNITLYATWYRDCTNSSNCDVSYTGFCGSVRYRNSCPTGQILLSDSNGTYNPECGYIYSILYRCDNNSDWTEYMTVSVGDTVTLPDKTELCSRGSIPTWQFNGWQQYQTQTFYDSGAEITLTDQNFEPALAGRKQMRLTGTWTGADSIELAQDVTACEAASGHWCTDKVNNLFTAFTSPSSYSCVADGSQTGKCCHDDPTNCNAFQCSSQENIAGVWNPGVTAYADPNQNYCKVTDDYVAFQFASMPYVFAPHGRSSYIVRPAIKGFKKKDELNSAWYYADDNYIVDVRYTNGTSYSTGRHKVQKLDYVPTYYSSALYPGFEFGGWYTGERCTGTQCIDGDGNVLGNTACGASNVTLYGCWNEIDKTDPGSAIKVYYGTCDGVLRCGTFANTTRSDLLHTDSNGKQWYGPLYVSDAAVSSPKTIDLYYDPTLTQLVPDDEIPRITGFGWYSVLDDRAASDNLFPDDKQTGHDFRQYAFNPITYAKRGLDGLNSTNGYNRLMVHPAPLETIAENEVSISCGTGQRLDAARCTSATNAYLQTTAFIKQATNYQRAPSAFYVGPTTYGSNNYVYYNMPCQCVKGGKFPCGWQTNDGRTLKTNVYYNNLNTVTSLTAVYECN